MNAKYLSIISAGAVALATSAPASALPLLFNFSGPSGTAMFQLDSRPTPDYVNSLSFLPGSDQFGFNKVSGIYDGVAGVASTINFGEGIYASLNIVAPGLTFTQFSSPTLFAGSASAPVFSTGSFTVVNPFFGNGTLTITPVAAAVPEPAGWALMVIGLGLIGATVRYRHRNTTNTLA